MKNKDVNLRKPHVKVSIFTNPVFLDEINFWDYGGITVAQIFRQIDKYYRLGIVDVMKLESYENKYRVFYGRTYLDFTVNTDEK